MFKFSLIAVIHLIAVLVHLVSEALAGAFDPFALVPEGDLDQSVDLHLLAVDLLTELGVDGEQLGDLLAEVYDFLFQ